MSIKEYKQTVTFIIFGVIFIICLSYFLSFTNDEALPIYNPSSFNPELVDKTLQNKTENHIISDFTLINQNGKTITQNDYKNKIYVADFFFTRCPSICPIMTSNMVKIQTHFLNNNDVMLLSLSVTPGIDSVSVLRDYATKKGVIDSKWHITTGNKQHIYNLARKSYFAVTEDGDGGLQDFIHTPHFILVDKEKQIRGIYDGTKTQEIDRIIRDITKLTN
ncbi:photosynthetic protein synthase II [Flavivirga aquatica]|uniref:Photosynthetic protein synthase II n=1 Tax=Flavivirga aquatica TaxID=1849968 RepID=A0A1E5TBD8_9FLAO|nr:SCO family protein [Flavivirga aquatica]OEK08703.1 photosynthetic protein synthase II [Flavivirga aquatica]